MASSVQGGDEDASRPGEDRGARLPRKKGREGGRKEGCAPGSGLGLAGRRGGEGGGGEALRGGRAERRGGEDAAALGMGEKGAPVKW
jgi:hypothetical protein